MTKPIQLQKDLGSQDIAIALSRLNVNAIADTVRSSIYTGGYDKADTMHNIYEDFGYPTNVNFDNLWNMYRRFGVAKAVVDILVDLTWVDPPVVKSENKAFTDDLAELIENAMVWNRLKGLDKRQ